MKTNETPEKLYVDTEDRLSDSILYGFTEKRKEDDIEYIRKDIVDGMLATAEDHAYFAGSESQRVKSEKIKDDFIKKACDAYCKVCKMPNCRRNECKMIEDFKKYIEE